MKDMKKRNDLRPLTKAEMEVMNVLWDATEALTIHEIIERYPEPRPAYTTIATFLKIIEAKGYVEHFKKEGSKRCFVFSPVFTREKYIINVMDDVKDSLFGNSTKKLFSFLIRTEDITDEELMEIMQMVRMNPTESMDTQSLAPVNDIHPNGR
jgi:predicted transcriptional regulator